MHIPIGKKSLLLLHLTGVALFITAPLLMYLIQGTDLRDVQRSLETGADMNAFFVRQSWLRFCVQNILLCGLFYANYLFLAPRFLIRGSWLNYFAGVIAVSIVVTGAVWYWHVIVDHSIGSRPMDFRHRYIETALTQFLLLAGSIALTVSEHNRKLILEQQEKERLLRESELQLLHSRINPHFIFNTLNNIYSLSITNSPSTSDALLRLSSLLRFLVYESGKETISLAKETEYITDYIALETIRTPENVKVSFRHTGESNGKIHPMLLIPFIENAFKHGRTMKSSCDIRVELEVNDREVRLRTENSIIEKISDITEKGIGQENTRRRLDLLYPGKHTLDIRNNGTTYIVDLTIQLHENPLHSN